MSKTVTALFDHYSEATSAVGDLEAIGIDQDDISIIANNAHGQHDANERSGDHTGLGGGTAIGAAVGGAGGLLAGLGLLAIPGLGPIVAAGWLAATAVGAGVGAAAGAAAGGIVDALKNAGHSDDDANFYAEGLRRGGTLVSAKSPESKVAEAEEVLRRHKAVDRETRSAAYRTGGWTRFDPAAPAYSAEEIERERATYGSIADRY
ncbi:hypothetical protein F9288_13100 [Sphingomonas sp. CL5.1]|uniref:hypothetical protein n=1 Tax=Sphingomonas sp. CL5.1 TaxID=2653203 RepID=UPI0015829C69|nr:hypothetical protein [Sphingomonas sp. CL5.1]QKS00452.1 hypothetical protein F9288_13100 [Sphingomonas sp. CL5.1]